MGIATSQGAQVLTSLYQPMLPREGEQVSASFYRLAVTTPNQPFGSALPGTNTQALWAQFCKGKGEPLRARTFKV